MTSRSLFTAESKRKVESSSLPNDTWKEEVTKTVQSRLSLVRGGPQTTSAGSTRSSLPMDERSILYQEISTHEQVDSFVPPHHRTNLTFLNFFLFLTDLLGQDWMVCPVFSLSLSKEINKSP
jgi:hypothetical protein